MSGLGGGRGKVEVGTRLCSLTDDILLVLYQLGLHHGGKLLQSLHRQLTTPTQFLVDDAAETQATAQPCPPPQLFACLS